MRNPPRSVPSRPVTSDGWASAVRRALAVAACASLVATTACAAQRAEAVARAAAVDDAAASRVVLVGGPGTGSPAPWATPGTRAGASAGAPVNATCPVWVGHTVDPTVTEIWQGSVIAFKDAEARRAWIAEPARYVGSLPRLSGSGGDGDRSRVGGGPKAVPAAGRVEAAPVVAAPASLFPTGVGSPTGLGSPDVPVAAPTELPPAVRRRPASAARVVPPPPASIGSPDAVVRAEPVPASAVRARPAARASLPSAPSAGALGSPDGPARPAGSAPAAPPRVAPAVRAAPAPPVVAPPCTPPTDDEEECPGGVCRVPGM